MYRLVARICLALVIAASQLGAISVRLAPNFDDTLATAFPNGDKPDAGCTAVSGWTETDLGDAGGEVCDQGSNEWDFSVSGTTVNDNAHIVHKDGGAGDIQMQARIMSGFDGVSEDFAGVGVGIRESSAASSWIAQCHSLLAGATGVQCQYGESGSYTTVNCQASGIRPEYAYVTYDVSSGDIKGFTSDDDLAFNECFTTNRALSDAICYAAGASRLTSATLQATLTGVGCNSTIDAYSPSDPPGGSPPTLDTPISDQTGTEDQSFSLDVSANFSGETSYTNSGLHASTGLAFNTSTGVLTGTLNANDVGTRSVTTCGVNNDGSTCDSWTLDVAASSGTTHTITTANTTTLFDCDTFNGGVNPGDVIVLAGGTHNRKRQFRDCRGTESSPITIRNDTSSGSRATINVGDNNGNGDGFLCRNCRYVTITGLGGWSGQTGQCGIAADGFTEHKDGCGILVQGDVQDLFKLRGERRFITIEGIELDGDWPGTSSGDGSNHNISYNDQAYCQSDHPGEWVEGITLRKSYIHHSSQSLTYLGANVEQSCGGVSGDVLRQRDMYVGYNLFEDGGWNGIHFKSCRDDAGDCIIEHNVVRRTGGASGTTGQGANSRPIACHESNCVVRYNIVDTATDPPGGAAGIVCSIQNRPTSWGTQDCDFYGNLVHDTDGHGISSNRPNQAGIAQIDVAIYNNTVVDAASQGGNCINVPSSVGTWLVRDNICAGNTAINTPTGSNVTNNRTGTVASQNFHAAGSDDYRLTTSSPARNNGTANCPSEDIRLTVRPKGGACDQGAYEFDE